MTKKATIETFFAIMPQKRTLIVFLQNKKFQQKRFFVLAGSRGCPHLCNVKRKQQQLSDKGRKQKTTKPHTDSHFS
jgi:hypothetical protein